MSAAFAPSPIAAHESAKKLVLFLLLYFAAEALRTDECRELLLDAMLMGGLALAPSPFCSTRFSATTPWRCGPRSFLGHYMTAAGVITILLDRGRGADPGHAPAAGRDLAAARSRCARPSMGLSVGGHARLPHRRRAHGSRAPRHSRGGPDRGAPRVAQGPSWPDASLSNALALAMAPVGGLALILSRTRSAWIGVVCGIAVLAAIRRGPACCSSCPASSALLLAPVPARRPRPADHHRREQPRPVLHVAGRPRHDHGQAHLRPGHGHDPQRVSRSTAGRARPIPTRRTSTTTSSRSRPSAVCPVSCSWAGSSSSSAARPGACAASRATGSLVLAALAATLSSGMFEYTLGDSEILMLVLLLSALPFSIPVVPEGAGSPWRRREARATRPRPRRRLHGSRTMKTLLEPARIEALLAFAQGRARGRGGRRDARCLRLRRGDADLARGARAGGAGDRGDGATGRARRTWRST